MTYQMIKLFFRSHANKITQSLQDWVCYFLYQNYQGKVYQKFQTIHQAKAGIQDEMVFYSSYGYKVQNHQQRKKEIQRQYSIYNTIPHYLIVKDNNHLRIVHYICSEPSEGRYHNVQPYHSCSQVWNKFHMDTCGWQQQCYSFSNPFIQVIRLSRRINGTSWSVLDD